MPPYRTNPLAEERERLARAWDEIQEDRDDLEQERERLDEDQATLSARQKAEDETWHRKSRSDLRRGGALLLWTLVLAGWAGLNAAWSHNIEARNTSIHVVMPADFCAPEVIREHQEQRDSQMEFFGWCVDDLEDAEAERDHLRVSVSELNDMIANDEMALYTFREDARAYRRECRSLGGCRHTTWNEWPHWGDAHEHEVEVFDEPYREPDE